MSSGPVRWSEVTALFGGTFDPPHAGHRAAVDGLFALPGVRSVRVIPSAAPPHKPTLASTQDRVAMVRLAFASSAAYPPRGPVELDLCEIERSAARSGALTYSFDTLNDLRKLGTPLAFVLGTDQFQKLPTWHRFPEVLGLCHWIVLERKSAPDESSQKPGAWRSTLTEWAACGLVRAEADGWRVRSGGNTFIQGFETQAPALSSTRIRESLARSGNPPTGSVQPEVIAYLMKHRLYGTGTS